MSSTIFEREPSEKSCGYCQFHGGFVWAQNLRHRHCIARQCHWLILFTAHRDYGTFDIWYDDHFQLYHGDPMKFLEYFGPLIRLPEAKDEDDEPEERIEPQCDYMKDRAEAMKRRRKAGTRKKPPKSAARKFREKKDERKEKRWRNG